MAWLGWAAIPATARRQLPACVQAALTEGLRTPTQLVARAERVVCEATEALLEVELSEEAAMECLRQAVPGIQRCAPYGGGAWACGWMGLAAWLQRRGRSGVEGGQSWSAARSWGRSRVQPAPPPPGLCLCRWMHRFLRADPAPDSLLGAGMDYGTGRDIRRMVAVQVGVPGWLPACLVGRQARGQAAQLGCMPLARLSLPAWMRRCVDSTIHLHMHARVWGLCVQEVVDIEESIWSTKFGVKGMIDVRWGAGPGRRTLQPVPWRVGGAHGLGCGRIIVHLAVPRCCRPALQHAAGSG